MTEQPTEETGVFAAKRAVERVLRTMERLEAMYTQRAAIQWLQSPQRLLDGRKPVDLLVTENGAKQVNDMLTRLFDGAYI